MTGSLGSLVAGPVLTATSSWHVVTIALSSSQQSEVKAGDAVSITLPDGALVAARPPAEAYLTRDLPAAKEYLMQLSLEFTALAPTDPYLP